MARRVVNLDEYRVATNEAGIPQVVLGGESYELTPELPISVVVAIQRSDIETAVRALFGASADKVLEAGLSVQDLDRIAQHVYGLKSGESPASAG